MMKKSEDGQRVNEHHEVEKLIGLVKSAESIVHTLTFDSDCYSAVNIMPR